MSGARRWFRAVRLGVLALAAGLAGGCGQGRVASAAAVPGGQPERGERLIQQYGCGSCHEIPGVAGAHGRVGPPLLWWSERKYIAGRLVNTPANLMRWIMVPQAVEPGTAMPNMGIPAQDARDIAAYLYTIGDSGAPGPPHLLSANLRHAGS